MAPSTSTREAVGVAKATENARRHRTSHSLSQSTAHTNPDGDIEISKIVPARIPSYHSNHGTPMKSSSHRSQPLTTVARTRPGVESELSGSTLTASTAHSGVYKSYEGLPIAAFLAKCKLYDSKKSEWTELRKASKIKYKARKTPVDEDAYAEGSTTKKDAGFKEKDLYEPLKDIIQAIFDHFDKDAPGARWVEATHRTPMRHIEDGVHYVEIKSDGAERNIIVKTSPDLSIMGKGSYVHCSKDTPYRPDYDHCLDPIEIKPNNKLVMKEVTIQVGIYARQCFIQQPHRRYVPTVVLTETSLYLFIYDRSGVLCLSEQVDIHKNAVSFVRIILGISSVNSNLKYSPFDTRVKWEGGNVHPTITVKKSSPDAVVVCEVYQVTGLLFLRRAIRGRGTVCWEASILIDGKLVRVLIKDSWRSADRLAEWELLDEIKGLPGVGQILAYEEDSDFRISDFRNFILEGLYGEPRYTYDRLFSRLVLKAYGLSIKRFKTKVQLLEALYDAVAGHKNLWVKGILHRDVSVENVLLGVEDADIGYRGILIDFDMAIKVTRSASLSGQFRTGTRAFQSVAVLSCQNEFAPPQDHLDDLESFFYVLGWICFKYDGTDESQSPLFLNKWEDDDPHICASVKLNFLRDPCTDLPAYFKTTIFRNLLIGLARLCKVYVERKTNVVLLEEASPGLADVHKADLIGQEHDKFLALIDEALRAQRNEPEPERPTRSSTQLAVTPTGAEFVHPPDTPRFSIRVGEKRQTADSVDDEEDREGSTSKRLRGSEGSSAAERGLRRSSRVPNKTKRARGVE